MRFHPAFVAALFLLLSGWVAWGQGADTSYVRIYNMIQEADGLRERGRVADALRAYRESQKELLQFKELYPSWHPNIVSYRLNYLASRVEPLAEIVAKTNVAAVATQPDAAAVEPSPEEKLKQMQEEIQRLNAQNALLQEKLREAWTARPALMDPQALTNALERIKELEKERDLLQVTLDERKSETTAQPADMAALEQERQLLAEVKQQLADEQKRSVELEKENESLRDKLAEAENLKPVAPLPDTDLAQQLAQASATIAELRATNLALQTQVVFLDAQLRQMTQSPPADATADRIAALEEEVKSAKSEWKSVIKERDNLQNKLDAAMRRLDRRKTSEQIKELERQLEEAQSRLDVLQAETVPLTPEEAALADQGATVSLALEQKPSVSPTENKAMELPPGAGPLIAQARRAIEQGRLEEAEEKLLEVLRQDENNVYTLANLAGVELELRRPAEAEKYLTKALSIAPNDPASLYLLGILKYQDQKYDDALQALAQSARLNPGKAETQYFLGLTLLQKGNRGPAETALRKAVQLRPGWRDAHYQLAVVYATQKPPFKELAQWHYDKAIQGGYPRNFDLEKLLQSNAPDNPVPEGK